MFMFAVSAQAQFANAGRSSSLGNQGPVEQTGSVRVSYLPVSVEDADFNGVMVSFVKTMPISQDMPLFVETGIGLSWIGDEISEDFSLNFFSVNVPLNLGYQIQISDAASISPFIGIGLRGNVFGNYKQDGKSYDAFDKDEVSKAYQLKRFNIGWRAGASVRINNAYIGACYSSDFNDIIKGGKASVPELTLGFYF